MRDCTLDKLHERIQTAMGWNTSHLHHFRINGKLYGDPWLMAGRASTKTDYAGFDPHDGEQDSTKERGAVSHFEYRSTTSGDLLVARSSLRGMPGGLHPGQQYPLCLEGEQSLSAGRRGRNLRGYRAFLEVIADPDDKQRGRRPTDDEYLEEIDDEDGDVAWGVSQMDRRVVRSRGVRPGVSNKADEAGAAELAGDGANGESPSMTRDSSGQEAE